VEILIVIAIILISLAMLSWLLKLVTTTVKTVLLVGFMALALYLVFGIGPEALWEQARDWLPGNQD
jgi:type IV secretory pathway TrbL component